MVAGHRRSRKRCEASVHQESARAGKNVSEVGNVRVSILEELKWRSLVADCTDTAELTETAFSQPITLYCGFDPTARQLCISAAWCRCSRCGASKCLGTIPFLWPAARPAPSATPAESRKSGNCSRKRFCWVTSPASKCNWQSCWILRRKQNPAQLLRQRELRTENVPYLEFLRDVGKHFSVNQMVAKESVRARMEDREAGISYTEFSYMLLQAFDFYVLMRDFNCELSKSAAATNGATSPRALDLCRKKLGKTVYGLTLPLISERRWLKVRQDGGGRGVARPAKNERKEFLPVLDAHGRQGRGTLLEILHILDGEGDCSHRQNALAIAGKARYPARTGPGGD